MVVVLVFVRCPPYSIFGIFIHKMCIRDRIRNTAIKLFGKDDVVDVKLPAMPAEDFSFYLKEKKGAFVWLGTAKPDQDPVWPLHNSRFDVDEDILWRGSSLLAQTAIDYLNK